MLGLPAAALARSIQRCDSGEREILRRGSARGDIDRNALKRVSNSPRSQVLCPNGDAADSVVPVGPCLGTDSRSIDTDLNADKRRTRSGICNATANDAGTLRDSEGRRNEEGEREYTEQPTQYHGASI